MNLRASIRRQSDGGWSARTEGRLRVKAAGASRDACLANLRRAVTKALPESAAKDLVTLVVEVVPELAGVAEAAEVMRWDKRRVITYIDRGRFPEPIQALASGRVWVRSDVEGFAESWRARRRGRHR